MKRFAPALARTVSVLGHPSLLVPLAAGSALHLNGRSAGNGALASVLVAAFVGAVVLAYAAWRVRAGHWQHVDASVPNERGQLNRLFGSGLLAGALLAHFLDAPNSLVAGLAASAAVVLVALGLAAWCKTSLHCGFAALAASFMWPHTTALACFAAWSLCVAWSRLTLARHTRTDVLVGLMLGGSAGCLMQVVMRLM